MNFLKNINIKNAVTNNFWLKIISLIIAIIIWVYFSGEIIEGIKI